MAIEESKIGADSFDQIDDGLLTPRPSSRIGHRFVAIGPASGCGMPISEGEDTWMIRAPIRHGALAPAISSHTTQVTVLPKAEFSATRFCHLRSLVESSTAPRVLNRQYGTIVPSWRNSSDNAGSGT